MTNKFRYFLGLLFVLVNRFFRLVYANKDSTYKTFKANRYYLPKGIMKTYNVIINEKNFYDQATDSDIKQYKEIRVLTTEQRAKRLYYWIFIRLWLSKNHYRLIVVVLSRRKESDVDPKTIKQIEFVRQSLNKNYINADGAESMYILTILEKIKEMRLKFFQNFLL